MKKCLLVSVLSCIRAGADRDNFTFIDDLWDTINDRPFHKATAVSSERFQYFICAVKFKSYRAQQEDFMKIEWQLCHTFGTVSTFVAITLLIMFL